jgi:hypothetical protein
LTLTWFLLLFFNYSQVIFANKNLRKKNYYSVARFVLPRKKDVGFSEIYHPCSGYSKLTTQYYTIKYYIMKDLLSNRPQLPLAPLPRAHKIV